jgi:pyruvate formate lyase activating enzyme
MTRLEIKGFVEASFCDWDGRISAVAFLPGCNLRCPFCQNGELLTAPDRLRSVDFCTLSDYLVKNKDWIDGVVVTGGEPTIWEDLPDLLGRLKALAMPVKLDTNGTRPRVLEALIARGLVDYVAMDVKAPLDERYRAATGGDVDLDGIRESIRTILACSALKDCHEFRTTLVPGIVGEEETVLIAKAIAGASRYALQQFVPQHSLDTDLRGAVPYTDDFILRLVELAKPHVGSCFFRGRAAAALSSKDRRT